MQKKEKEKRLIGHPLTRTRKGLLTESKLRKKGKNRKARRRPRNPRRRRRKGRRRMTKAARRRKKT